MSKEISVYVISQEQPFENWFGTWEFFQVVNGVSGYYVKNNKEELIHVNDSLVYEVDTNLPIQEFISQLSNMITLTSFGLSNEESELFIGLIKKMIIPTESIDAYNEMMEDDEFVPFEGGASLDEALILLQESIL